VTGDGTHTVLYYSTDKAGNQESNNSATVKIDTAKPSSQASAPVTVNTLAPFTVGYTASDPGTDHSGLAQVELFVKGPSDSGFSSAGVDSTPGATGSFSFTPAGEGTYYFYTVATDVAGNVEVPPVGYDTSTKTIVDTTAPVTHDDAPIGWQNSAVTVHLTATDVGGAGVDKTFYKVDGAVGFTEGSTVSVTGDGTHTVLYYSTDKAGNQESNNSATVKIDTAKPSSQASAPAATNGGFTVTYTDSDAVPGSGVAKVELLVKGPSDATAQVVATDSGVAIDGAFSYTPNEGQGLYDVYTRATDVAGNVEAAPITPDVVVTVNYDTTKPATTNNAPTAWQNSSTTVALSATDSGPTASGVDKTFYKVDSAVTYSTGTSVVIAAPADHSNDGVHTIAYYSTDKAGNQESNQSATVKIDTTKPTSITWAATAPADGATYFPLTVPSGNTCTATDNTGGSGIASCVVTGGGTVVGTRTITATATDNAGNAQTSVRTYTVRPAFTLSGFFQPVDMSGIVNTVKNGSTVPLKFTVFDQGVAQTSTSVVQTFIQRTVSCTTFGDATDPIELTTTGGTVLRYDTTAAQFIQNWQTPKKQGTCYQAVVTMIDGQTISANFMLK
jgi:hypothetical protein